MSFKKFGAFSNSSSAGGTPSSSIAGGGGLYAGISLGGPTATKKSSDETPSTDSLNPDHTTHSNLITTNHDQAQQSATNNPEKGDNKKDDDKSKASSWSSSLRFAPVIRKQPAKSTAKPFAVPFSSTTPVTTKSGLAATAFAPDDDHETASSNNTTARAIHIPGRAKVALNASTTATRTSKPPSVFARKGGFLAAHAPERIPGGPGAPEPSTDTPNALSVVEKVDSNIPGFKHSLPAMLAQTTTLKGLVPSNNSVTPNKVLKKKLDQPPPLTLPDDEFGAGGGGGDVNGFAQSDAGRKLALRAARNSKKSKKKGKTREVDPEILFMEDYDPARPNDYNEWMNFVKRRQELRRETLRPDFARRLMDKYGWKEGQGLGATESGRTSILTVAAASSAPGGSKKRKENPGDVGPAGPMGLNKIGAMAKGRGVVIDESKTQRDLAEKMKYGEPTRIVYLTNVVAVDEVGDELATEIAEEAGKHGIVERCFVRIVQRTDIDDPSEKVRVFILYSGFVGAWKAVKTFDGRFFGGRNIRARFFSENSFTLGDWDA